MGLRFDARFASPGHGSPATVPPVIGAFLRAAAQLPDPRLRRILWLGLAGSAAVLALLYGAVWVVLVKTTFVGPPFIEGALDVLGGSLALYLTWILFPAAVTGIVGFLSEAIALAVEARHYPFLPPAAGVPLRTAAGSTAKLVVLLVALNLLAAPLYLLLLAIPPFTVISPFVFYGVNGYLLGREYFEVVALRRLTHVQAEILRRARSTRVFLAGVVIAALMTVPIVNFVAPIIGIAAMVHLFERWRDRAWFDDGGTRRDTASLRGPNAPEREG
jgi:CysZ protein